MFYCKRWDKNHEATVPCSELRFYGKRQTYELYDLACGSSWTKILFETRVASNLEKSKVQKHNRDCWIQKSWKIRDKEDKRFVGALQMW